jgi:uncharacterized protein YdhG (YjbR/CyaY superfamily)
VDPAVQHYLDSIPAEHRPLFDRVHALVLAACPQAELGLSYQMPTYRIGPRRLYLGVWKHGVSLYGWQHGGDGGFSARHPELVHGKGTIRLDSGAAGALPDGELTGLIVAVLG